MAPQSKPYQPRDAVGEGIRCGAIGAGSGLFMAALRNSLERRQLGVMTVFTRARNLIGVPGESPPVDGRCLGGGGMAIGR